MILYACIRSQIHFICFHILSYASIGFHTLSYVFKVASIRFHTLSYAFNMPLLCFNMLLNAVQAKVSPPQQARWSLVYRLLPTEAGKKDNYNLEALYLAQSGNAEDGIE